MKEGNSHFDFYISLLHPCKKAPRVKV